MQHDGDLRGCPSSAVVDGRAVPRLPTTTEVVKTLQEVPTMDLTVLPEIRRRLFPLREEELAELERSVLEEGIRDPLVVWRRGEDLILVDGHTRYELAKKHNLSFNIVERNFSGLEEVLVWCG